MGVLVSCGCATSTAVSRPAERNELTVEHLAPQEVSAAADALAAEHEGDFTLTGEGESMEPAYCPGTVLVVHPTSLFMLKTGMAVVYRNREGRHVAHVIVAETNHGWVVQGLGNPEPDDECVTAANLVGVVRCAFVPDTRLTPTALASIGGGAEHGIALLH